MKQFVVPMGYIIRLSALKLVICVSSLTITEAHCWRTDNLKNSKLSFPSLARVFI